MEFLANLIHEPVNPRDWPRARDTQPSIQKERDLPRTSLQGIRYHLQVGCDEGGF